MKHGRSIVLALVAIALIAGCGKSTSPTSVSNLDTTPPPTPTNLRAWNDGTGHYSLTWSPSSAADLAGYEVWQCVPGSDVYTQTATLTAGSATCALPVVSATTDIEYRVRAYDTTGNRSAYSQSLVTELQPTDPTGGHRPSTGELPTIDQ